MNRIRNLALVLTAAATSLLAQTGIPVPSMSTLDQRMTAMLAKWQVPGGSLAVALNGRLVFAHGYGLANVETGELVQPDSLFRIASISKTFTGTGIMQLVEAGKLDLDQKVYPILRDLMPPKGQLVDERLRDITIRDLLHHTGGWDDHAKDELAYLLIPVDVENYFGMPEPPSARMGIRWVYSNMALDNDPGTKYAYSNIGYILLGRVIEEISGMRYEDYIRQHILTPAGIGSMAIAGDLPEEAKPREVRYYDYPNASLVPSIFPDGPRQVPAQYDMHERLFDSGGGWIASAIDLVRFAETYDGRKGTAFLKPETVQKVIERVPSLFPSPTFWYGLGWALQPNGTSLALWHDGHERGTRTLLMNWQNGLSMAMLFNSSPLDESGFLNDVAGSLFEGLNSIRSWPDNDLFPQYESAGGN